MITRQKPVTQPPEIDLDRVVWDIDYRKWAQQALNNGAHETAKRERDSGRSAER